MRYFLITGAAINSYKCSCCYLMSCCTY